LGLAALYRGDYPKAGEQCREALELFYHELARYDVGSCLMALAGVALGQGNPARAARLLGASEGIFNRLGAFMDYFTRKLHSQLVARLHTLLGEAQLAEARKEGADLTFDEAYRYGLKSEGPGRIPRSAPAASSPYLHRTA
jgi:hypothetical protein